MKQLILLPLVFALMFTSSFAHARGGKMLFGTQESIKQLDAEAITGPDGQKFYLAYKTTMQSFGLPYYFSNDGYVLSVSGDMDGYIPLTDEKIQDLQKQAHCQTHYPRLRSTGMNICLAFHYGYWG